MNNSSSSSSNSSSGSSSGGGGGRSATASISSSSDYGGGSITSNSSSSGSGGGIEVASIDSFQGREADAVIISMVRSNPTGTVGFLADQRRMNVGITRARCHVAIVADSSTLSHNPFLRRLLTHVQRNGEVVSAHTVSHAHSGHHAAYSPSPYSAGTVVKRVRAAGSGRGRKEQAVTVQ